MSQNDRFIKIAKIDDNFFGVKIQKKIFVKTTCIRKFRLEKSKIFRRFFSNALCLLGVIYVRASSHKRPS